MRKMLELNTSFNCSPVGRSPPTMINSGDFNADKGDAFARGPRTGSTFHLYADAGTKKISITFIKPATVV